MRKQYIEKAIELGSAYIIIFKDNDSGIDNDIYPVYFKSLKERNTYLENVLSEMKVSVVEIIKM